MAGNYGPVAVFNLTTTDMVAPGMPTFVSGIQVDNTIVRLVLALPTMDAPGSNLTGLTALTVVTAPMVGGVDPFANKSMTDILAMPNASKVSVTVGPEEAGQQKTVDMPVVNLGGQQAFCAACAD